MIRIRRCYGDSINFHSHEDDTAEHYPMRDIVVENSPPIVGYNRHVRDITARNYGNVKISLAGEEGTISNGLYIDGSHKDGDWILGVKGIAYTIELHDVVIQNCCSVETTSLTSIHSGNIE